MHNGLKFSKADGDVACLVKFIQGKKKKSSSFIKVQVKDTGVGMSEENKKRVFKQFGKLRENEKMNPNGVGLGLYACKVIC